MLQMKTNKFIKKVLRFREIGSLSGLVIIILIFTLLSEHFLTLANFAGIFTMTAELGIIAIGVTFLMISGEFDLSVGSVFAVAPMTGAILMNIGIPPFVGFLGGLLVAASIGAINGFILIKTKIPSFIVTLGSMMFFRGLLLAVSGGFQISYSGTDNYFLNALGGKILFGMGASGIWFIIGTIFFSIILNHTKYGNHVFAVGGNQKAAEAIGINVKKVKVINFIACSIMAGLAGFTMFGRFNSIDPTAGLQLELEAIASAVIGGAVLTGGYGSIFGAFIGAFLIGILRSGLVLAGAPSYWYKAFIGIILVTSVILNTKIKKVLAE